MKVRGRAPLRLSFGGGGTEISPYVEQFGGQVLNATINLHAYATLSTRKDRIIRFYASDLDVACQYELSSCLPSDAATALPLHIAIYNRIVKDYNGGEPLAIDLITYSDAPVGSGLGSSSTMTVAILKAFDAALGLNLDEYSLAHLAYRIERQDLGLFGGYQDQYAAAFGGINFIEFKKDNRVLVNPLRIKSSILSEIEASLLLYYTGVSRSSAKIIERQRDKIVQNDEVVLTRLHAMKRYAAELKEHILVGNMGALADTLHRSWMAKRDLSSMISDRKIDSIYDKVRSLGVRGGKISGAGGGGFMMLMCAPENIGNIERALQNEGGTVFRFRFSENGAESWRVPS